MSLPAPRETPLNAIRAETTVEADGELQLTELPCGLRTGSQLFGKSAMQLGGRQLDGSVLRGEFKTDAIAIDADPQAGCARGKSKNAPQLLMAQFVELSLKPQQYALAFIGDQGGWRCMSHVSCSVGRQIKSVARRIA